MGATAQPTRRHTTFWLALTLAWVAEISALSTATFSSERTETFLASLLAACHLYIPPVILDALHTVLRKLAHATVYAILSLFMYRTAAGGWIVWRPRIARLCVAAAAIYSLLDECHQSFIPERGPSLLDCGIDTTGAIMAILLLYGGTRWCAKTRALTNPDCSNNIRKRSYVKGDFAQRLMLAALTGALLFWPGLVRGQAVNACDLNADGAVNILDVRLATDMTLGSVPCTAKVTGPGVCDILVVQRIVDAALGGACVTGAVAHSVSLSWTASTSPNVSGYLVYRGTQTGGPYTKLSSSVVSGTTYTDTNVAAGQTYYYVATAVDTNNSESAYSNQATAVVPSP